MEPQMKDMTVSAFSRERRFFSEEVARFGIAGASCVMAVTVTNPIDVIKTRMQLDNELKSKNVSKNAFHGRYYPGFTTAIARIFKEEGVAGYYRGITPALLREAVYSTLRLGLYEPVKCQFGASDPSNTPLWIKISSGAISGAIGSSIACPTDLIKVRMMALPSQQNWRYRNTLHAFREVVVKEGFLGLWTGVKPTVQRAAIITAAQISSYDHVKHSILNAQLLDEGVPLHVLSSVVAGLITIAVVSPVDLVRTRVMNQPKDSSGKPCLYKGTLDCILKAVKSEGVLSLYKGFLPNWTRTGTHTVVMFFVFEQLRRLVGIAPM